MIKSVMKLDKDDDDDRRLLTERRRVKTGEKKRVFSRKEGEKNEEWTKDGTASFINNHKIIPILIKKNFKFFFSSTIYLKYQYIFIYIYTTIF